MPDLFDFIQPVYIEFRITAFRADSGFQPAKSIFEYAALSYPQAYPISVIGI